MLFNSYPYLVFFLPLTAFLSFLLNRRERHEEAKILLILASLGFYGYHEFRTLPVLLASVLVNYYSCTLFNAVHPRRRKPLLVALLSFNLGLLVYYKYSGFLVSNANSLFHTGFSMPDLLVPLGISYLTFLQIAYCVDSYRGVVRNNSFLNYTLFAVFFPKVISGPIAHHNDILPQLDDPSTKTFSWQNLSTGLFLLSIGLFKKVVVADNLAPYVNFGFDQAQALSFFSGWATSLGYTLQLYFDFSGYTDMALGSALFLNLKLPLNFASPYKSTDIRQFWQTWHITLGRFLRDYLYIPLGGNRKGKLCTYRNLLITFIVCGVWHGAGWLFFLWGLLHGIAIVVHRAWNRTGIRMHRALAWFLTFNFVNIAWIFFRAKEWEDALKVLKGMANIQSIGWEGVHLRQFIVYYLKDHQRHALEILAGVQGGEAMTLLGMLCITAFVVLAGNSNRYLENFTPRFRHVCFFVASFLFFVICNTYLAVRSEFIYFQF